MNKILIVIVILTLVFTLGACTAKLTRGQEYELIKSNKLKVNSIMVSYAYDTDDLIETIGYVDYIFVAKTVQYIRTSYESTDEIPDTIYELKVIENIKGKLRTDSNIEISKGGGLAKNHKSIYVINNNNFLTEGETYVFFACASRSGELSIEGDKSNIHIGNKENYLIDESYLNIIVELPNATEFDRVRYPSIYDAV